MLHGTYKSSIIFKMQTPNIDAHEKTFIAIDIVIVKPNLVEEQKKVLIFFYFFTVYICKILIIFINLALTRYFNTFFVHNFHMKNCTDSKNRHHKWIIIIYYCSITLFFPISSISYAKFFFGW
jgi:hypothetical protein